VILISILSLVILTWFCFFVLIAGNGFLLWSFFDNSAQNLTDIFIAFWVGWALILGVLQIWHLFFPVNTLLIMVLSVLSLYGWVIWLRRLPHPLLQIPAISFRHIVFLLATIFALVWTANRSIAEPGLYDTGLYHFQVVQWFSNYPTVVGIVNLYFPLGYSVSTHLYHALFDVGFWTGRAYHVANSLLLITAILYSLHSIFQLWQQRTKPPIFRIFDLFLIPIWFSYLVDWRAISNFSTDIPVQIGTYILVGLTLRFIETSADNPKYNFLFFVQAILIVALITTKLTFVIFGAIQGLFLLYIWWKRSNHVLHTKTLIWCIVAALLILVPWVLRSVLMNGYLIYPSSTFAVDVPWRESTELADFRVYGFQLTSRLILSTPELYENYAWLASWFNTLLNNLFNFVFPVTLTGISTIIIFTRPQRSQLSFRYLLLLLAPLSAIVFWFFSAPDFRYIKQYVWIILFFVMIAALGRFNWLWINRIRIVSVVSLGLFIYLARLIIVVPENHFLPAGVDDGLYPMQEPSVVEVTLSDGLKIWITPDDNRCWDAPLPCAPSAHNDLILREAGDLASGFIRTDVIAERRATLP